MSTQRVCDECGDIIDTTAVHVAIVELSGETTHEDFCPEHVPAFSWRRVHYVTLQKR